MRVSVGHLIGAGCFVALGAFAASSHAAGATNSSYPSTPAINLSKPLESPAGNLPTGPRSNGTAVLPDGRILTPAGREIPVELQPLNEVLSHDGKRLYVSSEGIDDDPTRTQFSDGANKRFVDVIDTTTGKVVSKIRDDALQFGMAETADGRTLYVSNGSSDSIGIISRSASGALSLQKTVIELDPTEKQRHVYPWGLAMSPDGKRLYAVGFISNTLYTVDINPADGAPHVIATAPTGQYPFDVIVAPDGKRVYVSNWGEYNPGDLEYATTNINGAINSPIVPPPVAIAGYNTTQSSSVWTYDVTGDVPNLSIETPIGNQLNGSSVDGGSEPSALALSPDGRTLAVTSSNDDLVELLDVTKTEAATELPSVSGGLGTGLASLKQHPARVIDLRVLDGSPTGTEPDALTWSPDGRALLIAEGGRDTVSVVDPTKVLPSTSAALADPVTAPGPNRNAVIGRIPTAWYPDGVVVSPDGRRLWILDYNGLGSGPNTDLGPNGQPLPATYESPANPKTGGATDLAYIGNTLYGMVQEVDLSSTCGDLVTLSRDADVDNGLVQGTPAFDGTTQATLAGDGYVVPTGYGQTTSDGVKKIKHVFLILKENRPYDQVFGDVAGTERDARFTDFGAVVTPNAHALVDEFASSDNFYVNSETSRDGHFSVDTGQITEFLAKTVTSSYAGKIPFFQGDTNPENLPEGGFIWDNAGRHGVTTRIYGEGTYIVGVPPDVLGALGTQPALNTSGELVPGISTPYVTFDALYPTQAALPVASSLPVYDYNDRARSEEFDRDLGKELQPLQGLAPALAKAVGDQVVPQLNVMILFDDHTAGDIGNAPYPRDYVAENDAALGDVVGDIANSPVWSDSAIFVTEDDTQGGQDHVDAHRSFDLVISPWAKRQSTAPGYVSNVHTSFSSITKTIDLLLGLPPTSLQELTATSLADEFVSGPGPNVPDLAKPVRQTDIYGGSAMGYDDNGRPTSPASVAASASHNFTAANAPNATLKAAAQIAPYVAPGIDQGGALGQYDLELEEQGLRELGDPSQGDANVVQHTLESGSPAALAVPPGPAFSGPAVDECLAPPAPGPAPPAPSPGRSPGAGSGGGSFGTLAAAPAPNGTGPSSVPSAAVPVINSGGSPVPPVHASAPSGPPTAVGPLTPTGHHRGVPVAVVVLALLLLAATTAGVFATRRRSLARPPG